MSTSETKNTNDTDCSPGKIMRKGYKRSAYKRTDGTVVKETKVDPVCIKDQGKPGKGPKTLPKPDDKLHLSKYGYYYKKSADARHKALRSAVKENDALKVLRRLNLLRNYQSVPEVKSVFSDDVEYMKKLYSKIKKNDNQIGGGDTDIQAFSEVYIINDTEIRFHPIKQEELSKITPDQQDVLLDMDKNKTSTQIQFIGMLINNKLGGVCGFTTSNETAEIVHFVAPQKFSVELFSVVHDYLMLNNIKKIIVKVTNINDKDISPKLNLWINMGLRFDAVNVEQQHITLVTEL